MKKQSRVETAYQNEAHAMSETRLSAIQMRAFLLCVLVAMLDGLDTQSIALVAKPMSHDLGLTKVELGTIFSLMQVGTTIGALAFGALADRFGRKPITVYAVATIAILTFLSTVASNFYTMLAVRFGVGIALGAVIPPIMTLASEYAPAKRRSAMVGAVIAGYPMGAAIGGIMAAFILRHFEWRGVFYWGAFLTTITFFAIAIWLPESQRFLTSPGLKGRGADRALATGVDKSIGSPAEISGLGQEGAPKQTTPFLAVFVKGLLALTLLLWGVYFFGMATTKLMVIWLPTLLAESGFSVSDAALAQASFNIGCVGGYLASGFLVDKFGPARSMAPSLFLGAFLVASLGVASASVMLTVMVAALIGVFVGIGSSGAYVLATGLYPPAIRATGIGWGVSASRVGQVASLMGITFLLSIGMSHSSLFLSLALSPFLAAVSTLGFALIRGRRRPAA